MFGFAKPLFCLPFSVYLIVLKKSCTLELLISLFVRIVATNPKCTTTKIMSSVMGHLSRVNFFVHHSLSGPLQEKGGGWVSESALTPPQVILFHAPTQLFQALKSPQTNLCLLLTLHIIYFPIYVTLQIKLFTSNSLNFELVHPPFALFCSSLNKRFTKSVSYCS